MRTLTLEEKRTIRRGAIGLGVYLSLFLGFQAWKFVEGQRVSYQNMVNEASTLKEQIEPYNDRAEVVKRLMETFQLDPMKLSRETVVGLASAKIQKTATTGGIQLGPIRESATRTTTKEMASLQFEGSSAVPALLRWLKNLETVGYPLIIDSLQITSDPSNPEQIKFNITIVILDFDQWKTEEKTHA